MTYNYLPPSSPYSDRHHLQRFPAAPARHQEPAVHGRQQPEHQWVRHRQGHAPAPQMRYPAPPARHPEPAVHRQQQPEHQWVRHHEAHAPAPQMRYPAAPARHPEPAVHRRQQSEHQRVRHHEAHAPAPQMRYPAAPARHPEPAVHRRQQPEHQRVRYHEAHAPAPQMRYPAAPARHPEPATQRHRLAAPPAHHDARKDKKASPSLFRSILNFFTRKQTKTHTSDKKYFTVNTPYAFYTTPHSKLRPAKQFNPVSLEEIWKWADDLKPHETGKESPLEYRHDWIQWIFPKTEGSQHNQFVGPVTLHEMHGLPKEKLLKSLHCVLKFYGLRTEKTHDLQVSPVNRIIRDPKVFKARRRNWLTPGNHNFLRLTRILKSLKEAGEPGLAASLYLCLLDIAENEGKGIIGNSVKQHWIQALKTTSY